MWVVHSPAHVSQKEGDYLPHQSKVVLQKSWSININITIAQNQVDRDALQTSIASSDTPCSFCHYRAKFWGLIYMVDEGSIQQRFS